MTSLDNPSSLGGGSGGIGGSIGDKSPKRLNVLIGTDTDIGGGPTNQDKHLIGYKNFSPEELASGAPDYTGNSEVVYIGIFDGHGRNFNFGEIAADTAKKCIDKIFITDGIQIFTDIYGFLKNLFVQANKSIKVAFIQELKRLGFDVEEDTGGYLLYKRVGTYSWNLLSGGSTLSIIVLVNNKLYTANVGDSSGLLCSKHPIFRPSIKQGILDTAIPLETGMTLLDDTPESDELSTTLHLTCDHSPESIHEFDRLRKFRSDDNEPNKPAILVVYDDQGKSKTNCNPVFSVGETGIPTKNQTGPGNYFKNVRKEWGSLVSAPLDARFSDSLAFTRSLGDYHMQTFGVSYLPIINFVDLNEVFSRLRECINASKTRLTTVFVEGVGTEGMRKESVGTEGAGTEGAGTEGAGTEGAGTESVGTEGSSTTQSDPMTVCVVLCTDGVWDNWIYDHVGKFVMDPSCLKAIVADPEIGASRVAKSFMIRNQTFSRKNFGSHADNATGIFMYITQTDS